MEKKKILWFQQCVPGEEKTLHPFPYRTQLPKIHARELYPIYPIPKKITTE
jgi:hypothetical protein